MGRLLIASVDTLPQLGGISMMTHHLANGFARQGHEVTVLGTGEAAIPPGMRADYRLDRFERANPSRREGPAWTVIERPNVLACLNRLWREHKFDHAMALHAYYFGAPLLEVAHSHGAKLSTFFHGYELRSQLMLKARWRSMRLNAAAMGPSIGDEIIRLAKQSNEVLVNSRYTAQLVKQTGTHATPRIIGCGLDLDEATVQMAVTGDEHEEIKRRVRSRLGIPPKAKVVGTLGRLVACKNPNLLVQLLTRNKLAYALIAGSGKEEASLFKLAAELGVVDRLRLVKVKSDQEKWDFLRAMDVFCLLSSEGKNGEVEGFGIVLLEANCAGVPTIAARSGGILDVIEHKSSGILVPPKSLSALDKAVKALWGNPDEGHGYVEAVRASVRERFNYQFIANELSTAWQLPGTARVT